MTVRVHGLSTIALLSLAVMASGCGPDCQSTCQKLYGTKPNCGDPDPKTGFNGLVRYGNTREELLRQCEDECESALDNPGDVGNYKPKEYSAVSEAVELETDKQAALWMDCIAETSCKLLDEGYCAPVW